MKRTDILVLGVGIGLLVMLVKSGAAKFHKIVKNQRIRGIDGFGSGAFRASRTHGIHNGLDIITVPGEEIFSPVSGTIRRYSYPYGVGAGLSGYHIITDRYLIKLWYIAPNQREGAKISAGQVIGFAQSLQGRHPGITNHAHIEVWDLTKSNVAIDPATLF